MTAEQPAGTLAARGMRFRAAVVQATARTWAAALHVARRQDVQFVGALLLAVLAARSCLKHTAGLNGTVAVTLALAATLPLTVVRIAPLFSLATTVAASGVFIVGARLAWPRKGARCWSPAI